MLHAVAQIVVSLVRPRRSPSLFVPCLLRVSVRSNGIFGYGIRRCTSGLVHKMLGNLEFLLGGLAIEGRKASRGRRSWRCRRTIFDR